LIFWDNLIGEIFWIYYMLDCEVNAVKLLPVVQRYFMFSDMGWTPPQISGAGRSKAD
jgi:hypothetical protein